MPPRRTSAKAQAQAQTQQAQQHEQPEQQSKQQPEQQQQGSGSGSGNGDGGESEMNRYEDAIPDGAYTLVLYRHYDPPRDKSGEATSGSKRMNQFAEAVLYRVLSMEGIPSLMMAMNGEWIVKEGRCIRMNADISLAITRIERRAWDVSALEITLFSRTRSATQMLRFVTELHEQYVHHLNNELGSKLYYFDQKERQDYRGNPFEGSSSSKMTLERKKHDLRNAPQHLSFMRMPFYSNKTFENLCGPEVKEMHKRVKFFMEGEEWYNRKGVPYQLGILLSGEAGTGKSSCIRAMANYTRRHVINVNFANIKTVTQLKKLFYSEDVYVFQDDDATDAVRLRIPLRDRIYVLEEIDALGSAILDRKGTASALAAAGGDEGATDTATTLHDEISLGQLLQVLDGIMETPGRIVTITSNHPELLDSALLRAGRIDLNIHFGFATRQTIADMYERLHDSPFPADRVNELPDGVLSPADANEVMFRHMEDLDAFVREITARAATIVDDRRTRMESVQAHFAAISAAAKKNAGKGNNNREDQEEDDPRNNLSQLQAC